MREDDGHIAAISCPQRSTQGSLPRGSFEVTLHWRRRLKAAGHRLPHLRPLHLGPCPPPPPGLPSGATFPWADTCCDFSALTLWPLLLSFWSLS